MIRLAPRICLVRAAIASSASAIAAAAEPGIGLSAAWFSAGDSQVGEYVGQVGEYLGLLYSGSSLIAAVRPCCRCRLQDCPVAVGGWLSL